MTPDERKIFERCLELAETCKRSHDKAWDRARKMQAAAALARAGKMDEAKAITDTLDRTPRVNDFGNVSNGLIDLIPKLRKALK